MIALGRWNIVTRYQRTLDVCIALIFWCTRANGAVTLRQALSIQSAWLSTASEYTATSNALIRIRTICMRGATISTDGFAITVDVGDHVSWTFTNQRSEWNGVQYCAGLIFGADVGTYAWVLAVLVDTCEL